MNSLDVNAAIQRLNEWEEQLKPWFKSITLLGEIPLSAADVEEIGQAMRMAGQSRVRKPTWPHTLVVYMAAVAARNDERRYWGVLTEGLGLSNSPHIHTELGALFKGALISYNRPIFPGVGSHIHVTPIRLHGGIPAYSLPDFFEYLLLPARNDPAYTGLEIGELIPALLQRSAVQHFVDSPVRYFLEHGGQVSEESFTRCLEMARRWEMEGAGLSAAELGLPRYVVDAFETFMEGQAQTAQGRRLRPPRLLLAPTTGDALFNLELPEEPVDGEQAAWRYAWRIQPVVAGDGSPLDAESESFEDVRVRRAGHELITVGRSLPLFLSPCQLHISFEATSPEGESRIVGRWRAPLAPTGDQSLLAFRVDGSPLRSSQVLPAELLWLLYPSQARLEASGEARCAQTFPDLLGGWADWQVVEWDLRKARSLWLVDENGVRLGAPLAVQQAQTEARLLGENQLAGLRDPNQTPLFVGTPPALWLPRLTGDAAEKEMEQWHIELTPRWVTQPHLPRPIAQRLHHWQADVAVDKSGFTLPLAGLLGEEALGSFGLEVRGPRNFRQELRLRLWSGLAVEGLAAYYPPGPQGAQAVDFLVRVAPGQQVAVPVGETETTVAPGPESDCYRVTVAATASEAVLELLTSRSGDEPVRLVLRLAVPRLRWLLRLDDSPSQWRTTLEDLPAARFVQSQQRTLILDWGGAAVLPYCTLRLLDATQQPATVLQEEDVAAPQANSQRLLLNLGSFFDTVQGQADVPILTLALGLGYGSNAQVVPLLYLKRSLEIDAVVLEWDKQGQTQLHWDAPHRLRNRRVRIWSAWRPWEAAREYAIPDGVPPSPVADGPGSGVLLLPDRLPVGWYRVALRTAHSWEPLHAPPLPTDDALLSQDGDWELRALELDEAMERGEDKAFPVRFELACIYDAVDKEAERDANVQWLCRQINEGTPHQVAVLTRWLQQRDPHSASAVRMRMYQPGLLQRLFAEEENKEVRNAYLEGFTGTRLIKAEAAQLVLAHTLHPSGIVHSLNVLLDQAPDNAIDYLLAQMEKGAYGDRDALNLLTKKPADSFAILKARPRTPARDRLLLALTAHVHNTDLIRKGDWVRCEAGWGRIERIASDGKEQSFCFVEEKSLLLRVTLRYGQDTELIEIDTARKTICFTHAERVYHCTKDRCTGFSSYSERLLIREHNRAAHMGIEPSFMTRPACSSYRQPLHFSQQQPDNLFL